MYLNLHPVTQHLLQDRQPLGVRQEMKELVYLNGCSVVLVLFAFPGVPAHLFTEGE